MKRKRTEEEGMGMRSNYNSVVTCTYVSYVYHRCSKFVSL